MGIRSGQNTTHPLELLFHLIEITVSSIAKTCKTKIKIIIGETEKINYTKDTILCIINFLCFSDNYCHLRFIANVIYFHIFSNIIFVDSIVS